MHEASKLRFVMNLFIYMYMFHIKWRLGVCPFSHYHAMISTAASPEPAEALEPSLHSPRAVGREMMEGQGQSSLFGSTLRALFGDLYGCKRLALFSLQKAANLANQLHMHVSLWRYPLKTSLLGESKRSPTLHTVGSRVVRKAHA